MSRQAGVVCPMNSPAAPRQSRRTVRRANPTRWAGSAACPSCLRDSIKPSVLALLVLWCLGPCTGCLVPGTFILRTMADGGFVRLTYLWAVWPRMRAAALRTSVEQVVAHRAPQVGVVGMLAVSVIELHASVCWSVFRTRFALCSLCFAFFALTFSLASFCFLATSCCCRTRP